MTILDFEREIMNLLIFAGAFVLGLICLFFMLMIAFAYDLGRLGSVIDAARSVLHIMKEEDEEEKTDADQDSERGGE